MHSTVFAFNNTGSGLLSAGSPTFTNNDEASPLSLWSKFLLTSDSPAVEVLPGTRTCQRHNLQNAKYSAISKRLYLSCYHKSCCGISHDRGETMCRLRDRNRLLTGNVGSVKARCLLLMGAKRSSSGVRLASGNALSPTIEALAGLHRSRKRSFAAKTMTEPNAFNAAPNPTPYVRPL
ncbi:hypothetical protein EJ03DRAFT_185755 [Teratosphaeria nubilosa]|uniref:Uncharacterized protein n=1 Tax=Teratosphaeria nubilosa TaxID=161662 RepID=A0A6G1LJY3_9PEZI|nr:hypothetical protein EJ03DRAFT_185755 [Teratosphaeria nubilosa]